jgi:hypothetical protein
MKIIDVVEKALLKTPIGGEKTKLDQARGSDPWPKKSKPATGPTQRHPLRGKLVGGSA